MTPSNSNSTPRAERETRQPQRPATNEDEDFEEVDLAFTEEELTNTNSSQLLQEARRSEPEPRQPERTTSQSHHPSTTNNPNDLEEVDLAFTEQELPRKNSFDFVIDEKARDDAIHEFLHGKPDPPKVAAPPPVLLRNAGSQYGHESGEDVEMTDFSRERDLEAGLGDRSPAKDNSSCVSM
ncbi:uncharacterized protein RCC_10133 [Ramularia collo-cygni]|uniref:Uncharacterized protein n=1 Tax=Ramularia collo-cygni TaxID=112498 RepID=A0A2D3VQI8_9PEZI|nr:uncharacterized protein RCC_10133 [Ramularia collo-cygni]CZT24408.1 uncharacterized protein RCC_10133 [Ramularia collo-cygni]